MTARDEPAYLLFARANARQGVDSSPTITQCLLDQIDNQAREMASLKSRL